jgi:hypothetical protein
MVWVNGDVGPNKAAELLLFRDGQWFTPLQACTVVARACRRQRATNKSHA